MKTLRQSLAILTVTLFSGFVLNAEPPLRYHMFEAYPDQIKERSDDQINQLMTIFQSRGGHMDLASAESVIDITHKWIQKPTLSSSPVVLTVAFYGGNPVLDAKIAEVASEWTNYGNFVFDFGYDPFEQSFRSWSPTDTNYSASIRVFFDGTDYWSLIGDQSVDTNYVYPEQGSMSLAGFDNQLPSDWKALVLHEFGHAIGLEHEQQSPVANCQFRWNDDPGYVSTEDLNKEFIPDANGNRPGIYTIMKGAPNYWPASKVDQNFKQLPISQAYPDSPFDPKSIMEYHLDDWMFVDGTNSQCYNPENMELSDFDKAGALYLFPRDKAAITNAYNEHRALIGSMIKMSADAAKKEQSFQSDLIRMQSP